MKGKRRPCVRCGRGRLAHDLAPLDDCLSYVEPAPLWLRTLNIALAAVLRRYNGS